MKPLDFQRILNALERLSHWQRDRLVQVLSQPGDGRICLSSMCIHHGASPFRMTSVNSACRWCRSVVYIPR